MQAGAAGAPEPARRTASAPRALQPAAVGDPRHLLDVDVQQLAGGLALVAHRRRGAAAPGGVSLASLRGRLLRSARPSPRRLRRSHLHAVWRLAPIWRETRVSRPLGVEALR